MTEAQNLPANAPKGRALIKVLIRIGIGVAVVAILVARTPDRSKLTDTIASADIGWVIAGAAALFGGLVVSAFRWRAYLDALEIELPVSTILRLYFVGTFFNAFLPSGIGGDAYKAVRVGRSRGGLTNALASVFLDRFAGFVALGAIGLGGALIELIARERLRVAGVASVLSAGMLSAAAVLLLGGERLLGRGRLIKEHGIGGKLREGMRAIHAAGRHRAAAGRGYLFGLIFQALALGYHVCMMNALNIDGVSIAAVAGVVVIASLVTIIPLSPGGLGFREAAYVWALGTFGVPSKTALAFALLILAILLATSLAGGLVYVIAGGEVAAGYEEGTVD